jgi:2-methylcitrate dehydratase PrpD
MVCRNGLTGALLAEAGAWASPTVLEGKFGFIETFLGSAGIDHDAMLASLGRDYAVLQSCEKRYPGTGLNQVPIELMRELVRAEGLRASDIEKIEINFPVERQNFAGGHGKGPFTPATAPSSAAFQCGALLLDGDLNLARYGEPNNPDILDIVERTSFNFVAGKSIRYARLVVSTKDGRRFEREGDEFFFEPEPARVIMEREARGILPAAKIERFLDLIANLEHVDDASTLVESLTP